MTARLIALLMVAALSSTLLFANDEPAQTNSTASQPTEPKSLTPAERQKEREEAFKSALDEVVLRGTFQMTNAEGLKGKAPLTSPRPERYEIDRVSKGVGDNWVVLARIQYADRDVRVPVPVRVVWAEDTAIITLDSIPIPMIGDYSARVVIHDGFYAGTWSGKNYGGVLSGQIVKKKDEEAIKKLEDAGWNMRMPEKADAKTDEDAKRQASDDASE